MIIRPGPDRLRRARGAAARRASATTSGTRCSPTTRFYWVPLVPDQEDGINHTSHLYEDKLLRELRIERLKSPRAFSQQPPSRCHHLLQTPTVEAFDAAANRYVVRSEFHYTESQGDELQFYVGTCFHHLTLQDGALRMTLKRVNLLNCDAALPAVQLFI